ncbi:MAG: sugar phosphate isomerase/epimerase family protein [Thermodesulfobacteriota bacterium]|nr:sugar phosphate isomerase/epimerase family protein [Thermodesulfobacteriota bacterium]
MREILKEVQVNMPFQMLVDEYLEVILKERINPEIGLDCFVLDRFSRNEFRDVANLLHGAGLSITLHAPFFDLRPGAIDRKIREVTIERLRQVFDLVPLFKPRSVVCHAAFDDKYYVSNEDVWLENSRDTWSRFIETAAGMGTKIAIENVYENSPKFLSLLLDTFKESRSICFCFDTGHFNAFSQATLEEWVDALGSRICQIHLHDNNGFTDEHNPVGEGTFPFYRFFELLKKKAVQPIITLEPHTEENLWRTLENIKRMGLLDCSGE